MLTADALKDVKLFQGLPDKELRSIASEFKEVRQPAGAVLAVTGKGGIGFTVILAGEADVETVDGRRRPLGAGDHFGEMALLEDGARSADVKAKTELRVGVLAEWGFKQFLAAHPEVAWRLLQGLSRRVREAEAAGTR